MNNDYSSRTHRSALLLGTDAMQRIGDVRVIIFGVGGVGSWCAESLVRTGIRHLTLVDSDVVCPSNCNRQLMATASTVEQPKVQLMRERLLDINPQADITALQRRYTPETAGEFHLESYDYVVDAIDSLPDKAHLILTATSIPSLTLFCSMGAALRLDPTKVCHTEFWKVKNDALARALRNRFKREKVFPKRHFQCVYSEEPAMKNHPSMASTAEERQPNGSLSFVTGAFGLCLSSLLVRHICEHEVASSASSEG